MMLKKYSGILFAFYCLSCNLSCTGKVIDPNNPSDVYGDAEEDISQARYELALEKLRNVRNKFPYSSFSAKSLYRSADVYFLQGSYAQSAIAYESFLNLHPTHELAKEAMFHAAESHFLSIPSPIARDIQSAEKAVLAYKQFLERFPDHEKIAIAKNRILEIQSLLAEKDFYIAEYYRKQNFLDSAARRYEALIKKFPETPLAQKAKIQLQLISTEDRERQKNQNLKGRPIIEQ